MRLPMNNQVILMRRKYCIFFCGNFNLKFEDDKRDDKIVKNQTCGLIKIQPDFVASKKF